jgi:hypothetical protein
MDKSAKVFLSIMALCLFICFMGIIISTRNSSIQGCVIGDFVALHLSNGERVYGKIAGIGFADINIEEYSAVYHPNIFYASLGKWKLEKLDKFVNIDRGIIERIENIKANIDANVSDGTEKIKTDKDTSVSERVEKITTNQDARVSDENNSIMGCNKDDLVAFNLVNGKTVYGVITSIKLTVIELEECSAIYHPDYSTPRWGNWSYKFLDLQVNINRGDIVKADKIDSCPKD